ncbi:MAG TPA: O-acetyl-ADP-ribose deacetylase [bacterium]|nr:O-acetyl-ADP-ribose deacetylase [bacterium]HPQ80816.1 O-acetyl-ADP-ribose deacetylase [bacterium]
MKNEGTLELIRGDIVRQETAAIVNAANSSLLGGGGVDGAIHRAAGPRLLEACRALPEARPGVRCPPGEARITPGFDLPAAFVIHTVGPVYRDGTSGEDEILASAYRSSLDLALERGLASVSFPSIGTGAYRYPVPAAARVALGAVLGFLGETEGLELVRFVLFSERDLDAYRQAFEELTGLGEA